MTKLSELAIEAHGGLRRWKQFEQVSADLEQGGALWSLKGQPATLERTTVTVGLRKEWASHAPFGPERRRSRFEPGRVALEAADGTVLDELRDPRSSFAGHTLQTPWTELQLAYFAGCAMWTYLNTPFVLAWPGVEAEELEPVRTNDALWRRLAVRFPKDIATHTRADALLRRRWSDEAPRLRCGDRRQYARRASDRWLRRSLGHPVSDQAPHLCAPTRRHLQHRASGRFD
jgi:hypothetical protein